MNPKERIIKMSKINESTGCWEWIGSLKGKTKLTQYGNMVIGSRTNNTRKSVSAHRYSYEIFNGDITNGLWVLHRCDNPKCVNPEHLFLGTRKDNTDDRQYKNRNKPNIGELNPNCKHKLEEINKIKELYKNGKSMRYLANMFGYKGHKCIFDIVHGNLWNIA